MVMERPPLRTDLWWTMRFDRWIQIIELVLLRGESPELSHRADFEYYPLFR